MGMKFVINMYWSFVTQNIYFDCIFSKDFQLNATPFILTTRVVFFNTYLNKK